MKNEDDKKLMEKLKKFTCIQNEIKNPLWNKPRVILSNDKKVLVLTTGVHDTDWSDSYTNKFECKILQSEVESVKKDTITKLPKYLFINIDDILLGFSEKKGFYAYKIKPRIKWFNKILFNIKDMFLKFNFSNVKIDFEFQLVKKIYREDIKLWESKYSNKYFSYYRYEIFAPQRNTIIDKKTLFKINKK